MNQVVTGYRWTDDAGLVPVWGPPALAAATPAKKVTVGQRAKSPSGTPKPDKVITDWSMPGKIFRIKAYLHQPDGRLVIVYGNGFDHCMRLLDQESKAGLPWSVEVSYNGRTVKAWRRDERPDDMWGTDCCVDLIDRVKATAKQEDEATVATRVRELESCP